MLATAPTNSSGLYKGGSGTYIMYSLAIDPPTRMHDACTFSFSLNIASMCMLVMHFPEGKLDSFPRCMTKRKSCAIAIPSFTHAG